MRRSLLSVLALSLLATQASAQTTEEALEARVARKASREQSQGRHLASVPRGGGPLKATETEESKGKDNPHFRHGGAGRPGEIGGNHAGRPSKQGNKARRAEQTRRHGRH